MWSSIDGSNDNTIGERTSVRLFATLNRNLTLLTMSMSIHVFGVHFIYSSVSMTLLLIDRRHLRHILLGNFNVPIYWIIDTQHRKSFSAASLCTLHSISIYLSSITLCGFCPWKIIVWLPMSNYWYTFCATAYFCARSMCLSLFYSLNQPIFHRLCIVGFSYPK